MDNGVLFSIKPYYVKAIMDGEKRYEFRKKIFKSESVKKVYIYASSPVKKIVGYFELNKILEGSPEELWDRCSEFGGISKKDYFEYYLGKDEAYALKIDNLFVFDEPICPYSIFENFTPPQSFMYFDHELEETCLM